MDWVYHHGTQDGDGSLVSEGSVQITLPDQAGMYFVQMLANNGYHPMTDPIEFTVHSSDEVPFTYLGCYIDSGDRDLNGGASAVATNPFEAAYQCLANCAGFDYFGLQWSNECFCSNRYGTQGEAEITDCDEDGVLDDDGTASLCANGVGNCGWRNAVYATNTEGNACGPPGANNVASPGAYWLGDGMEITYVQGSTDYTNCVWTMGCGGTGTGSITVTDFLSEGNWDYLNVFSDTSLVTNSIGPAVHNGGVDNSGDLGRFSGSEDPGTIDGVAAVQYISDWSYQEPGAGVTFTVSC